MHKTASLSRTRPSTHPSSRPSPRPKTKNIARSASSERPRASSRRPSPDGDHASPNVSLGKSQDEIKRIFRVQDADGDGLLNLPEFKQLFEKLGGDFTDEQILALFAEMDQEADGKISFEDFVDSVFGLEGRPAMGMTIAKSAKISAPSVSELEVEIPMGGGGVVLGGKLGNVVVNKGVMAKVKVGWRVVALDGERMDPGDLGNKMKLIGRRKFTLTFAVDEKGPSASNASTKAGQKSKRARARAELEELLGCHSILDLGSHSEEKRREVLSNPRLPGLLVDAQAVHEARVLLGETSAEEESRHVGLVEAVSHGQASELAAALNDSDFTPDVLKKDEDGNLLLHIAQNAACAAQLVGKAPETRLSQNLDGRNSLNEKVAQNPDGPMAPEMLECLLGDDPEVAREVLLSCDRDGVCAAMRLPSELVAGRLPDWESTLAVLQLGAEEMLPSLEKLAGKDWAGLLAVHCFQDVLVSRSHTSRSWERLGQVWHVLDGLLKACGERNADALDAAKALLKATQGPSIPPVDMRLPYRALLSEALGELHEKSTNTISSNYDQLEGEDARWLKIGVKDELSDDIVPDVLAERGLWRRLRMDYKLKSGGGASESLRPDWYAEKCPDLETVYADLSKVGMVGQVRKKDAAYDMLRLGGMGEISSFAENQESLLLSRYYGAYMRGVCQQQNASLNRAVQETLGDSVVDGSTFIARKEAKGFPRIMEKTLQRIEEINTELKDTSADLGVDTRTLLRQSAAFICDINGVTCVAESPQKLRKLYEQLCTEFRVLRVKNSYLRNADCTSYRDLKLFLGIPTAEGEMTVEVQLILEADYAEKRWMHLPYAFERGDFDWHHTKNGLSTDYLFRQGWNLYHGISGQLDKRDKTEALGFLLAAARQGHFVARGICHREGCEEFECNNDLAYSCFAAAAGALSTAGQREAKCRLGIYYFGRLTDVAAHQRRAKSLFEEAAAEGDVEALFQLAIHEYNHRTQQMYMQQAARNGHQRAVTWLQKMGSVRGSGRNAPRLADMVDV